MKMIKNKKGLLGAATFLFLLAAAGLHFAAEGKKETAAQIALENRLVETFQAPAAPPVSPFPTAADLSRAAEDLAAAGIQIETVSENAPLPQKHGEILSLSLSGTADFGALLEMFDIIQEKEQWMCLTFRKIVREGDRLRFEAELAAYRGRSHE